MVKVRPTILKGEKVSLSPIMSEDKERWLLWFNDRDIQNFVNNPMNVYFEKDFDEVVEEVRKNKNTSISFAIVENSEGELVGFSGLEAIHWQARNAFVWYFLGKEHWEKGYATEALALMCRFAFENMNLIKLHTIVYEPNKASIRVLEKNGFKLVGRFRKHFYIPGHGYVDGLAYELLREEWQE